MVFTITLVTLLKEHCPQVLPPPRSHVDAGELFGGRLDSICFLHDVFPVLP